MPLEPDASQQHVLDHERGALLVTGGPGTGKTVVLRERFARLLEGGADPERIALVVRSRPDRFAARTALFERLGASLPTLNVFTVHALANHILSRRAGALGHDRPPSVMTAAEQFATVAELLDGQDPAAWKAYGGMLHLRGFADEVRNFLLRAQEALLEPDDIAARAAERDLPGWRELAVFYREYLDVIDAQGRLDFAGQVRQAAAAAGGPGDAEPMFDHLVVDDYQEATLAIEALIAALAPLSLVVAGDPDAHVFSFTGTTDLPIRRFTTVLAGAAQIELTTNHRSAAASHEARLAVHTAEEHQMVARELRRIHIEEGIRWNDLAVIVRRGGSPFHGLLRALDDAGVPRRAAETWTSLAAEPATMPYVLALRWLAHPDRRDGMVESLLTSELAGLSPAAARGLIRAARAQGLPRADALALDEGLTADETGRLVDLRAVLDEAVATAGTSVIDTFRVLWTGLACSRTLVAEAERRPGRRRDLDAVLEFARAIDRAGELGDDVPVVSFLDALGSGDDGPGFSADARRDDDAVRVLTAHGAAGLEFDTVVIVGAVEGDFPSLSRPEPMFDLAVLEGPIPQATRNRLRLEDERRLFSMVVGRARRRVLLTASDTHDPDAAVTGRSRFADELGVTWRAPEDQGIVDEPISQREAAARWRATLADLSADRAERLASLAGLLALDRVDPARWWFQRDWTGGDGPLKGSITTSYSRLNTLENCELQFVLAQELGLGGRSGYQAWAGSLFHDLVEDCDRGKIERTPEALRAEARRRWRAEEFPSFAVSEEFKRLMFEEMIPHWLEEYGDPAAAVEEWFEFELDGAKIHGYIDRIGAITAGGFRITDYKTGKPKDLSSARENLQLGVYWLGVSEDDRLADYRPVRAVELAFVRGDKGAFKRSAWQPSSRDLEPWLGEMRERLRGLLAQLRARYDDNTWHPNTAADCYFCELKTMCPLYPEGRSIFPVHAEDVR